MDNLLSISCHKATLLIEKGNFESLTVAEKVKLRIHLRICKACERYLSQSHLINNALTRILDERQQVKDLDLKVDSLKKDIIKQIEGLKDDNK